MKVEFSIDEVLTMAEAVLDGVGELKLGRKDTAALRRWRNNTIKPTTAEVKLLAEKLNRELQHTQDSAQKSGIVKPDWV